MSRTHRVLVVLALNLALVVGLVAAGASAHSLAVLAEGGDYLLDAAGAGVALLAIRLSARRARLVAPQGRASPTSVAALVNGAWLLILELVVASAAVVRLATGTPHVNGLPVLVASGIASLVMTGGALVLRSDTADSEGAAGEGAAGERNLSVAAVLLDTIADAAAAAGVAAAGGVILATGGWYWLDPAVALTIAVVVAWHAFVLIMKVLARPHTAAADDAG
jgi:cation diffusion facilitator family transporter